MSPVSSTIPSTNQAVGQINQAQDYLETRAQGAGEGAKRTVNDISQALKDAKTLVKEKDLGNTVAKLADDAQLASQKAAQSTPSGGLSLPGVDADTQAIADEAYEATRQLRRISQLLVTSPSFRHFLWNTYTLVRDTFGPEVDRALEQRLNEGREDDLTKKLEANKSRAQQEGQEQLAAAKGTFQQAKFSAQQGDAKTAIAKTRDRAQEAARDTKQAIREAVPEERRQQLQARWNRLIDEINNDPNLQAAIHDLKGAVFHLRDELEPVVEQVKGQAKQAAQEAKQVGENIKENTQGSVAQVAHDARELIEKFADGKSLQNLINIAKEWVRLIEKDQELRQWLDNVYNFTVNCAKEPNRATQDGSLDQLNRLIDRGRALTRGRHQQQAEKLLDESQEYLYALRNDRATNQLRKSLNNVIADLFIDKHGKFVVKPDVYAQLKDALAPSVHDIFRDVRIAHVEEHNPEVDFAVDNIVIDASDMQPNQLDITNVTDLSLGKEKTGLDFRFRISCKGLTPTIRNAYFRYEKHTFPKLSDFGTLDASLHGDGLSFNIDIEYAADVDENSVNHTFRARDVTVSLKHLKLDFHNANHEVLYKIFKPLIISRVTQQMEKTIRDQLYYFAEKFDEAATEARFRALEAADEAVGDRVVRGVTNNVGQASRA